MKKGKSTPVRVNNREQYELRDNMDREENMLFSDRGLNREYLDMVNEEKNRHSRRKSIFSSGVKRSPQSNVNFEAICQEQSDELQRLESEKWKSIHDVRSQLEEEQMRNLQQ